MCEIVRALIAAGKFPSAGSDVTNLQIEPVIYSIDCAGEEGQTEVCAATAGSYANKKKWLIMLEGMSMQFGGKPVYVPIQME